MGINFINPVTSMECLAEYILQDLVAIQEGIKQTLVT